MAEIQTQGRASGGWGWNGAWGAYLPQEGCQPLHCTLRRVWISGGEGAGRIAALRVLRVFQESVAPLFTRGVTYYKRKTTMTMVVA